MITSITINGLRGISHGEVVGLAGLSILVGPNGCGKSTVLDALLIGAALDPAAGLSRAISRRAETIRGRGAYFGPQWISYRGTVPRQITIAVDGLEKAGTTEIDALPYGATIRTSGATAEARVSWSRNNCRIEQTSPRAGGVPVALVDPIEDASAPLHEVYSNAVRLGRVAFANDVLRDLIPGFDRLEILTEDNEPVLYMSIGDTAVPVAFAGEGIRALVWTVLELAACADGGLALLEEPEVHQHPRSLRLMTRGICAAVARGVQVVLTTHSLEMVEALLHFAAEGAILDRTAVHLVRLRDSELTATRVEGERARFQIVEIGEDLR